MEAVALLPFGERNGAARTFGIGELEDVIEMLRGARPAPRVDDAAPRGENAARIVRVGGERVAHDGLRAECSRAGGDGVGVGKGPDAVV